MTIPQGRLRRTAPLAAISARAAGGGVVDILRRIVTDIKIHPLPERGKVDIRVSGVLAEILAIARRNEQRTGRTVSVVAGDRLRYSRQQPSLAIRIAC